MKKILVMGIGLYLGLIGLTINEARAESGVLDCFHEGQASAVWGRFDASDFPSGAREKHMVCYDRDSDGYVRETYLATFGGIGPGLDYSLFGHSKMAYAGFGQPEGDFYGPEVDAGFVLGGKLGLLSNGKMIILHIGGQIEYGASVVGGNYTFKKLPREIPMRRQESVNNETPVSSESMDNGKQVIIVGNQQQTSGDQAGHDVIAEQSGN